MGKQTVFEIEIRSQRIQSIITIFTHFGKGLKIKYITKKKHRDIDVIHLNPGQCLYAIACKQLYNTDKKNTHLVVFEDASHYRSIVGNIRIGVQ